MRTRLQTSRRAPRTEFGRIRFPGESRQFLPCLCERGAFALGLKSEDFSGFPARSAGPAPKPYSLGRKESTSTRRHILRAACYYFFACGILALGYTGFVFAASHTYQTLAIKKFEKAVRLSEPHTPVEGDTIGEIQISRLGLNTIVLQGDSLAGLRRAVGHLSRSPLPGEWGNVALAGHRDIFFRPLRDIRAGDEIRFKTQESEFKYRVESMEVVAPTDLAFWNH